jgi:hypothetical protein
MENIFLYNVSTTLNKSAIFTLTIMRTSSFKKRIYEEYCFLGCDTMWSNTSSPMFQLNSLPPATGKKKPSKQPPSGKLAS